MATPTEAESQLDDSYQTTIPAVVRSALQLGRLDRLRYSVRADGTVLLSKIDADDASQDAVLAPFLSLMRDEMLLEPARLPFVTASLAKRLQSLGADLDQSPMESSGSEENAAALAERPLVSNGWRLYAHPLFLDQVEALARTVADLRQQDPQGYRQTPLSQRLTAIAELALNRIPQDPTRSDFGQRLSRGEQQLKWFRARFLEQYRLFFLADPSDRLLIYTWVEDDGERGFSDRGEDSYFVLRYGLEDRCFPERWEPVQAEASANPARWHEWERERPR